MIPDEYKNKNIILATHAYLADSRFNTRSGPTQPLIDYFSKKINYFFLIGQPPPYINGSLAPFLFVYQKGILKEKIYFKKFSFLFNIPEKKRKNKTYLRLKIRDFISVLYFAKIVKKYIKNEPVWLYFGVESVNAATGKWIKNLLNIEYNIYYIFDWSVRWFKNALLNYIYVWFDKYACRHSDYIWNITDRIAQGRLRILKYDEKKIGTQLTVPYGMPFRGDLVREGINGVLDTIVYSGYLTYENGAMILPEIAKEIEKIDKNIKIVIIGSGEQFQEMKEKITESKLKNVFLKGHIANQDEIDRLLAKSHIAIAPYKDIPYSKKKYGDVIKIRNYFACGLPVIITEVPPVAKEIADEKLGFVAPYNAKEFARSCIELLSNKQLYSQMRNNVLNKAKNHHWDNIFGITLEKMFNQGNHNKNK